MVAPIRLFSLVAQAYTIDTRPPTHARIPTQPHTHIHTHAHARARSETNVHVLFVGKFYITTEMYLVHLSTILFFHWEFSIKTNTVVAVTVVELGSTRFPESLSCEKVIIEVDIFYTWLFRTDSNIFVNRAERERVERSKLFLQSARRFLGFDRNLCNQLYVEFRW